MINAGLAISVVITYFRTKTTTKTNLLLPILLVATSLLIHTGVTAKHHQVEDKPETKTSSSSNVMFPLKTFFLRTHGQYARLLTDKLQRKGQYHNYLSIKQIRSRYCLGYDVMLKVQVDDTTFFNPETVFPKRPEVEWVEDALDSDMTWVLFIHYESWAVEQYEDNPEVFCPKQSVSIDLSEDENDDQVYYSPSPSSLSNASKQQR